MVYKTIILSDIHVGSSSSRWKECLDFLENQNFKLLILNGDILDGWKIKSIKNISDFIKFTKKILKIVKKKESKLIYIRGNHDDFLDGIIPFDLDNITITKDYIYESFDKKYYILHGDIFDVITTNLKILSKIGDIGYNFLLYINRLYNKWRKFRGKKYYSLSSKIKNSVKSAVSYISSYEKELTKLAKVKKVDGVICGHIHHPEIKNIENTLYLNSGDWVESLTALVENLDGEWEIIHYDE
jgi:UDP-2,3-diacylglucosamine pyrophosphatase LpxH